MSEVVTWDHAVRMAKVPKLTKLVCLIIATYMGRDGGGAFPSFQTIADDCDMGRSTVIEHVKNAVKAQLLTVERRKDKKGEPTSNLYKLCFPDHMNLPRNQGVTGGSEQNAMNPKGGSPGAGLPSPGAGLGVVQELDPIEERKKDNNIIGRAKALPDTTQKPSAPKAKRGTRLPDDFVVPADWREQALREHPNLDIDAQALRFTRYWQSAGGQKACKVNWRLVWLNWCDSPINQPKRTFEPSKAEKLAAYKQRIGLL
jgi:hypothetical protein